MKAGRMEGVMVWLRSWEKVFDVFVRDQWITGARHRHPRPAARALANCGEGPGSPPPPAPVYGAGTPGLDRPCRVRN
ncbi:hypothetical protein GCM10010980_12780 [Corynebacterium marinum]|nr:hypothetical protein GCM10010980_12780 [Corynebacterium marinum]